MAGVAGVGKTNRGWRTLARVALTVILFLVTSAAAQSKLTVAAAANLQPAISEIADKFEKQTGVQVSLVFGSSGNLATQIEHGAPFDLFFSADMSYPERLANSGFGNRDSLRKYAAGKLVLWGKYGTVIDFTQPAEKTLLSGSVRKIAIPNPAHAPYGVAAVAYLKQLCPAAPDAKPSAPNPLLAGVCPQIADKLVLGEDVAQTAQFVLSGNAEVGIIPLALALAPQMAAGKYYFLKDAPPVQQGAIIVSKSPNKAAAARFLEFMNSADATSVLRHYGYEVPAAATGAKP